MTKRSKIGTGLVVTFAIISSLMNIFTYSLVASIEPGTKETVVYKSAVPIPGPMGLSGLNGKDSISRLITKSIEYHTAQPIYLPSEPSEPCTTFTEEETGDTIVRCPDGTESRIVKPQDGNNGNDGISSRIDRDSNGNLVVYYGNDGVSKILYKKCEIQETC